MLNTTLIELQQKPLSEPQQLAKARKLKPYDPDDSETQVADPNENARLYKDSVAASPEVQLEDPAQTLKGILRDGRSKVDSLVHNATGSLLTPIGVAAIAPNSYYIPIIKSITVPQWHLARGTY